MNIAGGKPKSKETKSSAPKDKETKTTSKTKDAKKEQAAPKPKLFGGASKGHESKDKKKAKSPDMQLKRRKVNKKVEDVDSTDEVITPNGEIESDITPEVQDKVAPVLVTEPFTSGLVNVAFKTEFSGAVVRNDELALFNTFIHSSTLCPCTVVGDIITRASLGSWAGGRVF